MPYRVSLYPDMEEDEFRISVVDVYDLASEIGKEFEKIIDQYGAEAVTSLMPRVISSLEHLEKLTTKHEGTDGYIQDLKATIVQLENEKIGKIEDRQKYEKELEEIEDRLRDESHELVAVVSRLQDENRKLSTSLAKEAEGEAIIHSGCSDIDIKVVTHLKSIVESQRESLKKQDRELHDKNQAIDGLNMQLEQLSGCVKELRRRQRLNASQVRLLIDERADITAELQEERRNSTILKQRLGMAEKENQDLSLSSTDSGLDMSSKVVYERDDPNRPRFTLTELKEILYERNELKARVSDLEDELRMYRPDGRSQDGRPYVGWGYSACRGIICCAHILKPINGYAAPNLSKQFGRPISPEDEIDFDIDDSLYSEMPCESDDGYCSSNRVSKVVNGFKRASASNEPSSLHCSNRNPIIHLHSIKSAIRNCMSPSCESLDERFESLFVLPDDARRVDAQKIFVSACDASTIIFVAHLVLFLLRFILRGGDCCL